MDKTEESVIYMDVTYTAREWKKLMGSTHYQYRWSNPKSYRSKKDASRPPPGVRGVTRDMRALVDRAIRDSR